MSRPTVRSSRLRPALTARRYPFAPNQEVVLADWEIYLRETAAKVLEEQSPQRCVRNNCTVRCPTLMRSSLHDTRGRVNELLTHCIPADLILRVGRAAG